MMGANISRHFAAMVSSLSGINFPKERAERGAARNNLDASRLIFSLPDLGIECNSVCEYYSKLPQM